MAESSVYNGKAKDLRYINVDAKPGDPNTFWVSESGKYYRTYADAKEDDESKAVNPQDYAIKKTFYQQHKIAIWCCAGLLVAGFVVIALFDKNKLVYNNKKW